MGIGSRDTGQNGDKSKRRQPKRRQIQNGDNQNGDKATRRQTKTATIVVKTATRHKSKWRQPLVKTATTIGQNGDNHWSIATNIVYVKTATKTATNLNGDNGTATNQINEDDNCNFIRLMNCINIIILY